MEFEKGSIPVKFVSRGDTVMIEIEADILGKLAVHKAPSPIPDEVLQKMASGKGLCFIVGDRFQLTHVPTGRKPGNMVGSYEQMTDLARRLSALDWDFETPEAMPAETRTQGLRIIRRWREDVEESKPAPRQAI